MSYPLGLQRLHRLSAAGRSPARIEHIRQAWQAREESKGTHHDLTCACSSALWFFHSCARCLSFSEQSLAAHLCNHRCHLCPLARSPTPAPIFHHALRLYLCLQLRFVLLPLLRPLLGLPLHLLDFHLQRSRLDNEGAGGEEDYLDYIR